MTIYDDRPAAPGPVEQDIENGLRCWAQLAAHLSPLIGPAGFCALYARAQRVALPEHERMAIGPSLRSPESLLDHMRAHMGTLGPGRAMRANQAILDTFTRLLSGLIGARLTERLQASAWAPTPEGKP
jgi:hypothetical protein